MKKKKISAVMGCVLLTASLMLGACGGSDESKDTATTEQTSENVQDTEETGNAGNTENVLEDGVYLADFSTDSSMFHINEACDGKGTLTVKDGQMTIHITLGSKKIVNLYLGLAEDAAKDGADLLQPTNDEVYYDDGTSDEVYGFDVPVPVLDEEFDLALIGTKEKWYDHKVKVSNPTPYEADAKTGESTEVPSDGTYTVEATLEGGSGKATIDSPLTLTVKDGAMTATICWSSPNYDYMLVDGEQYLPVNTDGNSVFEIPVSVFDEPVAVVGDTVAMSTPHEIEYTITLRSETLSAVEE